MNIIIQQIKSTNEKQLILYQLLIMFDQLLQSVNWHRVCQLKCSVTLAYQH